MFFSGKQFTEAHPGVHLSLDVSEIGYQGVVATHHFDESNARASVRCTNPACKNNRGANFERIVFEAIRQKNESATGTVSCGGRERMGRDCLRFFEVAAQLTYED